LASNGAAFASAFPIRTQAMTPAFSVVSSLPDSAGQPESVAEKVRRLQLEAASLAREQVLTLENALAHVTRLATEIAEGGEAYPVGARELARRLAEDAEANAKTLEMIVARQH
jgi:hypothetical protein